MIKIDIFLCTTWNNRHFWFIKVSISNQQHDNLLNLDIVKVRDKWGAGKDVQSEKNWCEQEFKFIPIQSKQAVFWAEFWVFSLVMGRIIQPCKCPPPPSPMDTPQSVHGG